MRSNIERCIPVKPHPTRAGHGPVQSEARPRKTLFRLLATVILAMLAVSSFAAEPVNEWVQQIESANGLVDAGDLQRAAVVYQNVLESAQAAGDHLRAAIVLYNFGRLFDRKGQVREAEKSYLRAIDAFNRAGVTDERPLIRANIGLIRVYVLTRRYSKAETLIRRLLAGHPAAAQPEKASLISSLGVILAYKGRFDEAEEILRRAKEMCASTPDIEMEEVRSVTLANLGDVQMHLGRKTDAIASYQQAIAIMERLPHLSPAFLAVALADYAKALRTAGDRTTAANLFRRAIDFAETRLGQSHPVLGKVLQEYAELVRDGGRKSEARKIVTAARRIRQNWESENLIGQTVEIDALLGKRSRDVGGPAAVRKNR